MAGKISERSYVVCREKITSPAPPVGFPMPANVECGSRMPVIHAAPVMQFRCPHGHVFIAEAKDVVYEEAR